MQVTEQKKNIIKGPWGSSITSEHIAIANALKPENLSTRASAIWDSLAPEMVMLERLKSRFAPMFAEWCYQNAKIEELREWLEENGQMYDTTTRDGNQKKSHPYVAQVHEHWRQMLRLTEKFGLTPADEKSLVRSIHGDVNNEFEGFK